MSKDIDAVLDVVGSIITENKEKSTEQDKPKPSVMLDEKDFANSPPILLERTELLKAIESQSVELFAKIDSSQPLTSIFLVILQNYIIYINL